MKYRIVIIRSHGCNWYQAQFRPRWWPFWMICSEYNLSETLKEAQAVCDAHARLVIEYYQPKITIKKSPALAPVKSKTLRWFPEKPGWNDLRKLRKEIKHIHSLFSTRTIRNARRRLLRMERKPGTIPSDQEE